MASSPRFAKRSFGKNSFQRNTKNVGKIGQNIRQAGTGYTSSLFATLSDAAARDAKVWTTQLRTEIAALYPIMSSEAAHLILTATVNDAVALVSHIDRLDGRSAAHSARAIFEHLINSQDVESSPADAIRYVEHRAVTQEQVSRRRWYVSLLDKPAQAKESARLDKLGRGAKRTVDRLVTKYGSNFRRSWSDRTLKDRADLHGLGADYDGYRILSLVIHGNSGAMAGVVRVLDGSAVHRAGPDLDLAATAYVEGLRSARNYFDRLHARTDRPEALLLRDGAERLLGHTGEVRAGLARIDRELWPIKPAPPPMALLAFYGGGKERWFVFYPQTQTLLPAEDPVVDAHLLEDVRRRAREVGWVTHDGRPTTAVVESVTLLPRPGAKSIPAGAIMIPSELRTRPRPSTRP